MKLKRKFLAFSLVFIGIAYLNALVAQTSKDPDAPDGSTLCIHQTECYDIVECSGLGTLCKKSENGSYPRAGSDCDGKPALF